MSKVKRGDGLVYSTGSVSPGPEHEHPGTHPASANMEAVLRMERKGRGGKTVTIIELRNTREELAKELGKKLKNACGAGGTTKGLEIELQGDQRSRVRDLLLAEKFRVRG